jgi:phosphoglycolate phosphatase-like HAD superfamily hydrolase
MCRITVDKNRAYLNLMKANAGQVISHGAQQCNAEKLQDMPRQYEDWYNKHKEEYKRRAEPVHPFPEVSERTIATVYTDLH